MTRENKETVRNFVSQYYEVVLGVVFEMENQKKLFTSAEKCVNQWKTRSKFLIPALSSAFQRSWIVFFYSPYQKLPQKPFHSAVTHCGITNTNYVPHANRRSVNGVCSRFSFTTRGHKLAYYCLNYLPQAVN